MCASILAIINAWSMRYFKPLLCHIGQDVLFLRAMVASFPDTH